MNQTLSRPAFVATYDDGAERRLMPINDRELTRTEMFVRRVLAGDSIARGRYALLIASLFDVATMNPFERALIARGLIVCNAEANAWDGARTEATIRRFDVALVANVSGLVYDAIVTAGHDPAQLLQGKIVYASDTGYERLAGTPGIDLRRWATIGPVLAIEGSDGGGVHYDAREWTVEPVGNTTFVSSRLDRATPFDRLAVPIACRINPEPSPSGAFGERIVL
jgi:hypothetical protein